MAKKTNPDNPKPPALKIEHVKIDSLEPDPDNTRTHSERNLGVVTNSLEKYGQRKPIVVRNGVVIAGNATLEGARTLGWKKIAIVRADHLTDEESREFAIVDNRSSDLSEFDPGRLLGAFEQIDAEIVSLLGFSDDEIEGFQRMIDVPDPDPPAPPETSSEVVVTVRCSKDAFTRIKDVVHGWADLDEIEVDIS